MSGISSFVNKFNVVRQIPIFAKLTWMDKQKVARKAILCDYKKGDVIVREGSPPDFLYCLISGRLQSYSQGAKVEIKENLDFIHRGMHFGIISVLTDENHSLSIEALNDSVVLKISKEEFKSILKTIPQLGIELSQSLSQRIRSKRKGTKTIFESSIIAVYSPVAGTGSSTYAINLAMSLQKETKKKLIFVSIKNGNSEHTAIAEDKFPSTPKWKSVPIRVEDIAGDHDRILASITKDELDFDIINVCFDPKDAESKRHLSPFVSALVGDYHYVVVDLPNSMDEVVIETLTQADVVHLITSDRKKELQLIRNVIDNLEVALRENFREDKIKVIIRAFHDKVYLSFEEIDKYIDYGVYAMLPNIKRDQLNTPIDTTNISFTVCDERAEYTKALKRIAREIGKVMVGIALGGGAALGVSHVGVIKVLEEENIPVDMVVGSSMGALIGAMWCNGKDFKELKTMAHEFVPKGSMLKLLDPFDMLTPITGIIRGRGIRRWLKKHLGNSTFYGVKTPFKAVAYDLTRREEIVIDSGSLVEGVRQSIAIPGVLRPTIKREQVIIDGGVLNPLPTNILAGLGIKKIIAINVLQSPDDVSDGYDIIQHDHEKEARIPFYKNPFKYVSTRLAKIIAKPMAQSVANVIVQTLQATEYVIAEQSAQQADVVIHPDLVGINWFELNKADQLIKAGEDATREKLAEIKKLVEE